MTDAFDRRREPMHTPDSLRMIARHLRHGYDNPEMLTLAADGLDQSSAEIERLQAALDPDRQKVVVCEALIALNGPDPIVPPTAIDWIGNAIVSALQARGLRP